MVSTARDINTKSGGPPAKRSRVVGTLGRLLAGGSLSALVLAGWLWWTLLSPFSYQPPTDLTTIDTTLTHHVFAYGSLRCAVVRRLAMGRPGDPQPAVLPDYQRAGNWNVRPAPGEETHGVMFEVSAEELRRLDRYERRGIRYEHVEIPLADVQTVWVYQLLPSDTDAPSYS